MNLISTAARYRDARRVLGRCLRSLSQYNLDCSAVHPDTNEQINVAFLLELSLSKFLYRIAELIDKWIQELRVDFSLRTSDIKLPESVSLAELTKCDVWTSISQMTVLIENYVDELLQADGYVEPDAFHAYTRAWIKLLHRPEYTRRQFATKIQHYLLDLQSKCNRSVRFGPNAPSASNGKVPCPDDGNLDEYDEGPVFSVPAHNASNIRCVKMGQVFRNFDWD